MLHNYSPEQLIDIEASRLFWEQRIADDVWVRSDGVWGGTKNVLFVKPSDHPKLMALMDHWGPKFAALLAVMGREPPKWRVLAHLKWQRDLAEHRAEQAQLAYLRLRFPDAPTASPESQPPR